MKNSRAPQKQKRKAAAQPSWVRLPDNDLLQLRFKDLRVSIPGTWLQECVASLRAELKGRGLTVRPHAWLSDEWFSPDNTPGISLPFYLAHPRLRRLEREIMHEVEGGTRRECMMILRHEAGHVIQHAFALHRRKRWQDLFGRSSITYPNYYRPNPASKHFVQHLKRWYAQSHPDEDFAETFAVWLTPRSNWRKVYADWPALEKLLYVDELMAELAGKKSGLTAKIEVDPIEKLNGTLAAHYKKKLEHYAVDNTTIFDRDLRDIFTNGARHKNAPPAAAFLQRHREAILEAAPRWTRENELTREAMLDDMIERCRALKLHAVGPQTRLREEFADLLASKAVQSLYSSAARQWFAV